MVAALFGFSSSNFTKSAGSLSLAGEASLVSISGAVLFLRAWRVCLPLVFEFCEKSRVSRETMAAEISSCDLPCLFYCMEGEF